MHELAVVVARCDSSRSGRFYRITTNTPRLLYDGSRFLDENLKDERITREDVEAKIRESGHPTLESVAAVVLETRGAFVHVEADSAHGAWPNIVPFRTVLLCVFGSMAIIL
jgi:uncharacterized membrane protein YcaP (DUF421 family)